MKSHILLILLYTLLAIACKKKNPDPVPPKANHALKHSGIVDSASFSLDTSAVTPQLVKMDQWDDFLFKVFTIQTWLKGPHLGIPIQVGEEQLILDFSLILQ